MKKSTNTQDKPRTKQGTFADKGKGTAGGKTVGIGVSLEVYEALQQLSNRSDYIREALLEKMRRDGLLSEHPQAS